MKIFSGNFEDWAFCESKTKNFVRTNLNCLKSWNNLQSPDHVPEISSIIRVFLIQFGYPIKRRTLELWTESSRDREYSLIMTNRKSLGERNLRKISQLSNLIHFIAILKDFVFDKIFFHTSTKKSVTRGLHCVKELWLLSFEGFKNTQINRRLNFSDVASNDSDQQFWGRIFYVYYQGNH